MDMETACKQLKAGKVVRFWYCAADGAGNPQLMLDKKRILKKDIQAAKKEARKKQFCGGHMVLKKGVLTAFTDDGAPNLFDKKVKALLADYIPRPRDVEVKEAALADDVLQEEASDTGAQSLDEHYEGESEGMQWRAEMGDDANVTNLLKRVMKNAKLRDALAAAEGVSVADLVKKISDNKKNPDVMRDLLKKSKLMTTKYFSEQEAAEATIEVDDKGKLVEGGFLPADGTKGFAIDAESGDVRTFDPKIERSPDGGATANHHSSPVQGKDVVSAGHLYVDEGRLTQIDDQSGHYKPDATKVLQAVKHLEKMGVALVDERLLDEDGDPVDSDDLPDGLKRRAKWMKAYEKAHDEMNKVRGQTGEKQLPYNDQYNTIRQELIDAKVWFKNKSADVKLLGKNGITEKEWDKVEGNLAKLNKLIEKKTGVAGVLAANTAQNVLNSRQAVNFEIGKATSRTLTKEQFEQTGGNEAQIRAKDAMQAELLQKRGKVKATATDKTVAEAEERILDRRIDREVDASTQTYVNSIGGEPDARRSQGYDAPPSLEGDDEDADSSSPYLAPADGAAYDAVPDLDGEDEDGDPSSKSYLRSADNRAYDAPPDLNAGEED